MFSAFYNEYRSKVEEKINDVFSAISKCRAVYWMITEDEYNTISEVSKYVAQYGDLAQKKTLCRLLYEARTVTQGSNAYSKYYLALEVYFRKLCSPDLDKESYFSELPLDLNAIFTPKP